MFKALEYERENSILAKVSAIKKLLASLILLIIVIATRNYLVAITVILSAIIIITKIEKIPIKYYTHFIISPLIFIFFSTIAIIFEINSLESPVFKIGIFVVTQASLYNGVITALIALAGINIIAVLSFSTHIYEIFAALKVLKAPEVLIEISYFLYRYIFILDNILHEMILSACARGGFLKGKVSIKTAGYIMQGLLILSFKKANASFDAMQARGYQGKIYFEKEL